MPQLTLEEAREIALKYEESYSKIFRRFKIDINRRKYFPEEESINNYLSIKISFTSLDSLSGYFKENKISLEYLNKQSLGNIIIKMVSSMLELVTGK